MAWRNRVLISKTAIAGRGNQHRHRRQYISLRRFGIHVRSKGTHRSNFFSPLLFLSIVQVTLCRRMVVGRQIMQSRAWLLSDPQPLSSTNHCRTKHHPTSLAPVLQFPKAMVTSQTNYILNHSGLVGLCLIWRLLLIPRSLRADPSILRPSLPGGDQSRERDDHDDIGKDGKVMRWRAFILYYIVMPDVYRKNPRAQTGMILTLLY